MKKPSRKKWLRWLTILLSCMVVLFALGAGGVLFLAHDPAAAATFTDNVLRPLLGDKVVIALEGTAFGIQDKINKATETAPVVAAYQPDVSTTIIQTPTPSISASATPLSTPTSAAILNLPNLPLPVDAANPLTDEGIWKNISGTTFYETFIRTDATRPYAVVNLVYVPMATTSIGLVAGTKFPGGPAGPGKVPPDIQASGQLLAAFNGGFQQNDGHYGMYTDGVTYVPMRNGLDAFYIYADGHVTIAPYSTKTGLPTGIISARQNGPLLVKNGQDNPETSEGTDQWAGTANGDYITWRSGLGVTAQGDLIYAAGPSLTPTSLADALRLAGAQNALQLDINTFWVRFMLYTWNGSSYTWAPLVKDLPNQGQPFLSGYEKDFFYLYTKQ